MIDPNFEPLAMLELAASPGRTRDETRHGGGKAGPAPPIA